MDKMILVQVVSIIFAIFGRKIAASNSNPPIQSVQLREHLHKAELTNPFHLFTRTPTLFDHIPKYPQSRC